MKGVMLLLALVGFGTGAPMKAHTSVPVYAAPRIIVLYGGVLKEPVYLTDWWENLDFMLAVSNLQSGPWPRSRVARRTSIRDVLEWTDRNRTSKTR
jgi:hypothetical protein